jgi:hypothetical protein
MNTSMRKRNLVIDVESLFIWGTSYIFSPQGPPLKEWTPPKKIVRVSWPWQNINLAPTCIIVTAYSSKVLLCPLSQSDDIASSESVSRIIPFNLFFIPKTCCHCYKYKYVIWEKTSLLHKCETTMDFSENFLQKITSCVSFQMSKMKQFSRVYDTKQIPTQPPGHAE